MLFEHQPLKPTEPLAGLAIKVTPGFYLTGLSNVDKERNLQLLKKRGWFDIPVVYNNNRRAILSMDKGAPGELVFADAFKSWKSVHARRRGLPKIGGNARLKPRLSTVLRGPTQKR